IGRCCVEQLCQGGARVIIGCRNTKQGDQVIAECQRKQYPGSVEVFELDLQYFSSVRTFVERIKTLNRTIDVLVNNAGVGAYLRRPGRIVNVSSMQYQMGSNRRLCKNQQCSIHTPLFGSFVYGDAKLALNYWTRTLAHKLRSTSITVHSCHPGFVKTDIFFGHYGNLMHFTLRWLTHIFAKSPSEGAQTTLHLVLSSEAGHLSGMTQNTMQRHFAIQ
ncbi:retinol dehydrogenase 12-like, partial [Tropilaelaps mercedesae]